MLRRDEFLLDLTDRYKAIARASGGMIFQNSVGNKTTKALNSVTRSAYINMYKIIGIVALALRYTIQNPMSYTADFIEPNCSCKASTGANCGPELRETRFKLFGMLLSHCYKSIPRPKYVSDVLSEA